MSTATTPDTDRSADGSADPPRRGRRAGRGSGRTSRRDQTAVDDKSTRRSRLEPRRWPWIVALVVVVLLLCGAVYAVFFSPLLGVRAVSITGAPDEVTAKVRSVVAVADGTPLASIDLDDVAANVEAVPEISSVVVSRNWPDTLAIEVTPRVPVAVTSANGQFWLLDATGDPYLSVSAPPIGMVIVQLVAPGAGDPSTVAALSVVSALTTDFRAKVSTVSARTAFDVELTLADGRKVIWGEATDSAQKMQVLPAVLAAQDGTEYDVSDPTLVTVR